MRGMGLMHAMILCLLFESHFTHAGLSRHSIELTQSCVAGKYLEGTVCSDCPAGYFQDSPDQTECLRCRGWCAYGSAPGPPCPVASTADRGCVVCNIHCNGGERISSTACVCEACTQVDCKAGQYIQMCTSSGQSFTDTSCQNCPQGYYQDVRNQYKCHEMKDCESSKHRIKAKSGSATKDNECECDDGFELNYYNECVPLSTSVNKLAYGGLVLLIIAISLMGVHYSAPKYKARHTQKTIFAIVTVAFLPFFISAIASQDRKPRMALGSIAFGLAALNMILAFSVVMSDQPADTLVKERPRQHTPNSPIVNMNQPLPVPIPPMVPAVVSNPPVDKSNLGTRQSTKAKPVMSPEIVPMVEGPCKDAWAPLSDYKAVDGTVMEELFADTRMHWDDAKWVTAQLDADMSRWLKSENLPDNFKYDDDARVQMLADSYDKKWVILLPKALDIFESSWKLEGRLGEGIVQLGHRAQTKRDEKRGNPEWLERSIFTTDWEKLRTRDVTNKHEFPNLENSEKKDILEQARNGEDTGLEVTSENVLEVES